MKHTHRITALLLACMLIFTMLPAAFADEVLAPIELIELTETEPSAPELPEGPAPAATKPPVEESEPEIIIPEPIVVEEYIPVEADAASDFVIENGVLTAYTGTDANVVIPEGVTKIGDRVFSENTTITNVSLPSTLTVTVCPWEAGISQGMQLQATRARISTKSQIRTLGLTADPPDRRPTSAQNCPSARR